MKLPILTELIFSYKTSWVPLSIVGVGPSDGPCHQVCTSAVGACLSRCRLPQRDPTARSVCFEACNAVFVACLAKHW